ncbi:MAG: murein biosynthesis integral membrane protein MurJ [Klebsiella quasipneumoniae]|nr:murein biosynthesis integral membrane protein MurJ [Klebsiella quasipneumoniae]
MSIFKSAAMISGMTLISRITGLIRDILIVRFFGVSGDTDAYYVAFRLPNLLRRLFAEGAFQQAFVPMLADVKGNKSELEAKSFIDKIATLLATIVLIVSILGVVAAPVLVWIIASGLSEEPETFSTAVQLTRLMFPYIFFMSMVALCSSILNTWKHFAIPAAVPILLNLSLISATLFIAPHMERPIFALAIGVMAGGFLQLAVQIPMLKRFGVVPRPVSPFAALKDKSVRKVLEMMVPALFGVGVAQISILINTNIASFLQVGSVTWLTYADRLMEFPTALLGVALGTVLLPSLSAAFAKQEMDKYNKLLNWGLQLVVAFALPAAIGLAFLSEGLSSVLFQGVRFNANDAYQTSNAVLGYSFGLIGLIGVKILAPGFYAQKDIRTPVKVAATALLVTQLCNFINVPLFAHAGLALSVGMGSCFNAFCLLTLLRRRKVFVPLDGWKKLFISVAVACLVLAAILYASQMGINWVEMQVSWWHKAGLLMLIIAGAGIGYLGTLALFGYRLRHLRAADNM